VSLVLRITRKKGEEIGRKGRSESLVRKREDKVSGYAD